MNEVAKLSGTPGPGGVGEFLERGQAIQQVQTAYTTALMVQKPRDLKQVLARCVAEAELAGEAFYYHWETSSQNEDGTKKPSVVEGPSINCAMTAARNYGNCVVQQRPVIESKSSFIFTAAFIDLETGFTIERQYRMDRNFTVYGKMDQFRKDDIRFQIGQSKANRNVILNALPAALTEKMVQVAKESTRKSIEQRIQKCGGKQQVVVDEMLKAFAAFKVTKEMIEGKLGMKAKLWTVETLVMLSGDLSALKKDQATAEELFGSDQQDQGKENDPQDPDPKDPGQGRKPRGGKIGSMKLGDSKKVQGYKDGPGDQKPADPPPAAGPAQKSTPKAQESFEEAMRRLRQEIINIGGESKFSEELGAMGYESIEDIPRETQIRAQILQGMNSVLRILSKGKTEKLNL